VKKYIPICSDIKGPLRDAFKRNGLFELVGKENFYIDIIDAVTQSENRKTKINQEYIFQAHY